jgi:hypothetical protein
MTSIPGAARAPADEVDPAADRHIALAAVGPRRHGIARLALQIASAAGDVGFGGTVLDEPDARALESLPGRLPSPIQLLHLHVNDWLLGTSNCPAGVRFAALAAELANRGVRLSVTLHDLPQPADGADLNGRRTGSYQAMLNSAVGAVVSSEHERQLLLDALATAGPTADSTTSIDVIPLPIDRLPGTRASFPAPGGGRPTVGIFGYLYPGKGHREVLEELAGMDPAIAVVAIGEPSERHDHLLPELKAVADNGGIDFRCTGYLPDDDVPGQLRNVTIAVAPHTHVSASGSINSWIAAGRRPLVPAGRYVEELDRRMPGALWLYPSGQLRRSIERALVEPDLTMLPRHLVVGPSTPEVARRYLAWLRNLAGRIPG